MPDIMLALNELKKKSDFFFMKFRIKVSRQNFKLPTKLQIIINTRNFFLELLFYFLYEFIINNR